MIREIDKLMKLRGIVIEDDERRIVDNAINQFNEGFRSLLQDSRKYLMTGEKNEREYGEICTTMQVVRKISEKFQDEELVFPVLQNEKEARVYLAKYGKEVILNK